MIKFTTYFGVFASDGECLCLTDDAGEIVSPFALSRDLREMMAKAYYAKTGRTPNRPYAAGDQINLFMGPDQTSRGSVVALGEHQWLHTAYIVLSVTHQGDDGVWVETPGSQLEVCVKWCTDYAPLYAAS